MRQWFLRRLPAGVIARPAEWFLAIACSLSGLTIITGLGTPSSVHALLWHPVYYAWGATLMLGSLALMCGLTSIHWLNGPDQRYVITRTPCYRFGLRLLSLASLAYVVAVILAAGVNAPMAIFLPLAFAAMCQVRLLTIGEQ